MRKVRITLTASIDVDTYKPITMKAVNESLNGERIGDDRIITWNQVISNVECTGLEVVTPEEIQTTLFPLEDSNEISDINPDICGM